MIGRNSGKYESFETQHVNHDHHQTEETPKSRQ